MYSHCSFTGVILRASLCNLYKICTVETFITKPCYPSTDISIVRIWLIVVKRP